MCGICACWSKTNCVDFIVKSLKKLEYRGYDSAGIGYVENNKIKVQKCVGEIDNLDLSNLEANCVIGHTRWATTGKVSSENAHPHIAQNGTLALVHNGIIDNYKELKERNQMTVKSGTDSEVFANLIESENGDILSKVRCASEKVKGSFAIAILTCENDLVFSRRVSSLYISTDKNSVIASSDLCIFESEDYYALDDDEIAIVKNGKIFFYDKNGKKIKKNSEKLQKNDKIIEISDKTHMETEIFESIKVLENTYKNTDFSSLDLPKDIKQINLIACGTAYHSCLLGAEYFKAIGIPSYAFVASEFKYGNEILNKETLYVFVSQSGETADTIACAKMVKDGGYLTLAVTNSVNCYLNKICERVLPTFAGPEIAVASTKAFVAQVFSLYLLSLHLGNKKCILPKFEITDFEDKLVEYALGFSKIIFIGRGVDYITAKEASLKLKEISYINSIAIASGELKHGTLALVDSKTLVIAICTQEKTFSKTLVNIEEVEARGGKILVVTNFDVPYDAVKIPQIISPLMPINAIFPLQIFALKMCKRLGYNPDKPKNLAKSVTVE